MTVLIVAPFKAHNDYRLVRFVSAFVSMSCDVHVLVDGHYQGNAQLGSSEVDAFGARYAFSHIDSNGDWKDRLTFAFYECGHMMYIRKADLAKAKTDIADFVRSALPK